MWWPWWEVDAHVYFISIFFRKYEKFKIFPMRSSKRISGLKVPLYSSCREHVLYWMLITK